MITIMIMILLLISVSLDAQDVSPEPVDTNWSALLDSLIDNALKAHGYDGLYGDEEGYCGCQLGDLMPCGTPCASCEAGHKVDPPPDEVGAGFWIKPGKAPK